MSTLTCQTVNGMYFTSSTIANTIRNTFIEDDSYYPVTRKEFRELQKQIQDLIIKQNNHEKLLRRRGLRYVYKHLADTFPKCLAGLILMYATCDFSNQNMSESFHSNELL